MRWCMLAGWSAVLSKSPFRTIYDVRSSSSSSFFSSLKIPFIVILQLSHLLRVQRGVVFFFVVLLSVRNPFQCHSSISRSLSCSTSPLASPKAGSFTFFCDSAQMFLGCEWLAVNSGFCGTPVRQAKNWHQSSKGRKSCSFDNTSVAREATGRACNGPIFSI
jgi:hypothetical protein